VPRILTGGDAVELTARPGEPSRGESARAASGSSTLARGSGMLDFEGVIVGPGEEGSGGQEEFAVVGDDTGRRGSLSSEEVALVARVVVLRLVVANVLDDGLNVKETCKSWSERRFSSTFSSVFSQVTSAPHCCSSHFSTRLFLPLLLPLGGSYSGPRSKSESRETMDILFAVMEDRKDSVGVEDRGMTAESGGGVGVEGEFVSALDTDTGGTGDCCDIGTHDGPNTRVSNE